MSHDVIDDRIVLEAGNVQYLACIVPETYPGNPLKDMDQAVSFYVPSWGDNPSGTAKWVSDQLDGSLPDVSFERVSNALYERTMAASWYEDAPASDWLKLLRQADPSGLYFIFEWDDSGYGDTLQLLPEDDERTDGYVIAYRTAAQIREDQMVKRITKEARRNANKALTIDIRTQNAYFAGDVYGYYTLRQVLDDDGETIDSQEIEEGSCYGYYGSEEWEYMYSEAKAAAERDHAQREKDEAEREARDHWRTTQGYLSLDLFDAASYPEPSLYDVAGAYQARLNEGIEAIGECTRKLREEGYFNTGIIAIG